MKGFGRQGEGGMLSSVKVALCDSRSAAFFFHMMFSANVVCFVRREDGSPGRDITTADHKVWIVEGFAFDVPVMLQVRVGMAGK